MTDSVEIPFSGERSRGTRRNEIFQIDPDYRIFTSREETISLFWM